MRIAACMLREALAEEGATAPVMGCARYGAPETACACEAGPL